MDFEWDQKKFEQNLRLRELDFNRAIYLFEDPKRVVWEDVRKDYGEPRLNMLAKYRDRVLAMTYTLRGENVRVISLRKANKREQRKYERVQNGQSRQDRH